MRIEDRGSGSRVPRSSIVQPPSSKLDPRSWNFWPLLYNPLVVNVEILTIGNEILLGLVQDSNSNYLCRVVRGTGGRVRHIAVVGDEIDPVAGEINGSIARGAGFVFTCGGLGPTDDDVTLAGIAKATGRKLAINEEARKLVERRYAQMASQGYVADSRMTEARLKMAYLPEGAYPVANPVGIAPAVVLEMGGRRIVSLPGVPAELKAIVEGPLQPVLQEVFERGSYREREMTVDCGDESQLAPALRKVTAAHPDVYIKSRASHFGPNVKFRILLSATAASAEQAEGAIEAAASDLLRELNACNVHRHS